MSRVFFGVILLLRSDKWPLFRWNNLQYYTQCWVVGVREANSTHYRWIIVHRFSSIQFNSVLLSLVGLCLPKNGKHIANMASVVIGTRHCKHSHSHSHTAFLLLPANQAKNFQIIAHKFTAQNIRILIIFIKFNYFIK